MVSGGWQQQLWARLETDSRSNPELRRPETAWRQLKGRIVAHVVLLVLVAVVLILGAWLGS